MKKCRNSLSPARQGPPAKRARKIGYDRTTGHGEWLAPKYLIEKLGRIDFDPAAAKVMPWRTAGLMLTKKQNGLKTPWRKKAFGLVNPSTGPLQPKWLAKAAAHGNNITLMYARTDTRAFHKYVWGHASTKAIFFFAGRLNFCYSDGTPARNAGAPSVLIAYGAEARRRLIRAASNGLRGRLVVLGKEQTPFWKLGQRRPRITDGEGAA